MKKSLTSAILDTLLYDPSYRSDKAAPRRFVSHMNDTLFADERPPFGIGYYTIEEGLKYAFVQRDRR